MIKHSKIEIIQSLSNFIWEFEIGRNAVYNFKILFLLYSNKDNDLEKNKICYNKPITIFLVSIIEALLIDLLKRLNDATNDLPECLDLSNISNIKSKIDREKKIKERKNLITGEANKYFAMKKYDFKEIINYCEKFNLLFNNSGKIYKYLEQFAWLRNRIHIENYNKKFEPNEDVVFTDERLKFMEAALDYILKIMNEKYSRKLNEYTKKSNFQAWHELID